MPYCLQITVMLGLVSKLTVLFNSKMIRKITRNLAWCDFVSINGKSFCLSDDKNFSLHLPWIMALKKTRVIVCETLLLSKHVGLRFFSRQCLVLHGKRYHNNPFVETRQNFPRISLLELDVVSLGHVLLFETTSNTIV